MRDDGINYLQDLFIVPPKDIARVASELAAAELATAGTTATLKIQVVAGRGDSVCDAHAVESSIAQLGASAEERDGGRRTGG